MILFIYFERGGRDGEREEEKHQCVDASPTPPTGDLASNSGMCPDWELNQWPFGSQVGTQSTESHQPGLGYNSYQKNFKAFDHIWYLNVYNSSFLTYTAEKY